MMNPPKNCIATSGLVACLLALCTASALAGTAVGTVTQVNGPMLLQRADGAIKAIALHSFVEQGDTLVTEKNTYAQLKFADDSEVTLKPNTQFKIEVLAFNAGATDNADTVFSLAQGAVEIRTGAPARSKPESIKLVVPHLRDPLASALVERKAGSAFVAEYIAGSSTGSQLARFDAGQMAARYPAIQLASAASDYRSDAPTFSLPAGWDAPQLLAQLTPPKSGGLAPGLYVHVIDGIINLSNRGGSQTFAAGQFGYTASFIKPPVVVPNNPGIQFSPPPAFSSTSRPAGVSGSGNKPKTVDCEVR